MCTFLCSASTALIVTPAQAGADIENISTFRLPPAQAGAVVAQTSAFHPCGEVRLPDTLVASPAQAGAMLSRIRQSA